MKFDNNIPKKCKEADQIDLFFAAKVDQKLLSFIPHEQESNIYCYLPTNIHSDWPYLVNSDFMLSKDRMQLITTPWNDFLFYNIGFCQFLFLSTISRLEISLKYQIFSLFNKFSLSVSHSSLDQKFLSLFSTGVSFGKSVAFILSVDEKNLLPHHNDLFYDTTRFFSIVSDLLHVIDSKADSNLFKVSRYACC